VSDFSQARRFEAATRIVLDEVRRITELHKPYNSPHEAAGVLREEHDEFWDDVKANRTQAAVKEAVQVAAVALRIVAELGRFQEAQDGSREASLILAPTEAEEALAAAQRVFASFGWAQGGAA
jgi:cell division septum initiation protein DivIVA